MFIREKTVITNYDLKTRKFKEVVWGAKKLNKPYNSSLIQSNSKIWSTSKQIVWT